MDKIGIGEYLETRYYEFSLRYNEMLREKTRAFLRTAESGITFDSLIAPDQFVYGDRLVVFLISGSNLKATVKIHYNPSEMESLVPKSLLDASETVEKAMQSLFNELGNLYAGSLKTAFLEMSYVVGISLPIAASCYDELISSDQLVPGRAYSYTAITVKDHGQFIVTLTLDNLGSGLAAYKYSRKDAEEDSIFL
ncbi:MAG TPA: hypothetical protein VE954_12775 [Oligoflexus sp.]|uniref:hypothetical protein n=1 Tax=Oligoflexus sp. TaxID=1971216 RepID=UPI002D73EE0A|nr:hypothetical protein [Oligoflexus sp.]HYX33982.1 hypothetical protein [Oligoflexus sp.]